MTRTCGLLLFALWVGALSLSLTVDAQTDQIAHSLRLAESAYTAGDYATAAQFYEEAVTAAGDAVPPALYYNLANAYFEADDLSMALVNGLRAQREIPRDADLARTLALIRALRVDVLGDETALIDTLAAVTTGLVTRHELSLMVFVLWCAAFAIGLLLLRPRLRRLRMTAAILSLMAAIGLVLLLGRHYVEGYRPAAVVTAFTAQALSGPGADYVPLFTLYNAAEGRILETQNGYARLLLPDGRQGWLPAEDLTIP